MSTENANRIMLKGFESFVEDLLREEEVEININLDRNEVFWLRQLIWREMEGKGIPKLSPMSDYENFLCSLHERLCDEANSFED